MPDPKQNRARILAELTQLATAFPAQVITARTFTAWLDALDDLDADDVRSACLSMRLYRTSHFCPTPGEIREVVYELTQPDRHSALDAWQEVIICKARTPKHGEPPVLPDWAAFVLREYGQLPTQLHSLTRQELRFERRDFVEWYDHRVEMRQLADRRALLEVKRDTPRIEGGES